MLWAYTGTPGSPGDLDIWLEMSQENAIKVMEVIALFGFANLGTSVNDLLTSGNIIQPGNPPWRIDLLTEIDDVTFDACHVNRDHAFFWVEV